MLHVTMSHLIFVLSLYQMSLDYYCKLYVGHCSSYSEVNLNKLANSVFEVGLSDTQILKSSKGS